MINDEDDTYDEKSDVDVFVYFEHHAGKGCIVTKCKETVNGSHASLHMILYPSEFVNI